MTLAVVLQFASLAVVVAIGGAVLYAIFEMREVYSEQRERFIKAAIAGEESQRLQAQLVEAVKSVETSCHDLQDSSRQMQKAIVELRFGIDSAVRFSAEKRAEAAEEFRTHLQTQEDKIADTLGKALDRVSGATGAALLSSAERHTASLDSLANHIDSQEAQWGALNDTLERISDAVTAIESSGAARPDGAAVADISHLRREALADDSPLRFKMLKDWITVNSLSILRRAGASTSPRELIAAIPPALEAEAEILENSVLLVGTRGHSDRLALPLRHLEKSSRFAAWFELSANGGGLRSELPAVLVRSDRGYESIDRGTAHYA